MRTSFITSLIFISGAACAPAADTPGNSESAVIKGEPRPAQSALSARELSTLGEVLAERCSLGGEPILERLHGAGRSFDAALWEAYQLGPEEEVLERLSKSAMEEHARITEALARREPDGEAEPFLSAFRRQRPEEYRDQRLALYAEAHRGRALDALAQRCATDYLGPISELARSPEHPDHDGAARAMQAYKSCGAK